MRPQASIVINTLNRAASLERILEALRMQDFDNFEVIVVNGPSTDQTKEVLQRWESAVKVGHCPIANLSQSRNIGIAMAAGEIVAFIDDDAIPEPEWIGRLISGFDSDEIAGVGGWTFDQTGHEFQSQYLVSDRTGNSRVEKWNDPTNHFNYPSASIFCSLLGTNASFRRNVLIDLGGFDENYEYYLDETDLCARIVDGGWVIKYVPEAFVHHKFLPSHIRDEKQVVRNWYSIIKNIAYFAHRNALSTDSFIEVESRIGKAIESHRQWMKGLVGEGRIQSSEILEFEETAARARDEGTLRAQSALRTLLSDENLERHRSAFKLFPTLRPEGRTLTICFLSQDYPPNHNGGIARFVAELAQGCAAHGHRVHVISRGKGHHTVDLEEGVWVHRLASSPTDDTEVPESKPASRRIDQHALAAHAEVKRIDAHHRLDIIEAPIWDVEGLHCIQDPNLASRTLISLETTLKLAVRSQGWMINSDIQHAIDLETQVLEQGRAFHAISSGIKTSILGAYGLDLPSERAVLVPLGIRDQYSTSARPPSSENLRLLFVGRLERRKGVDILLGIAPKLLEKFPRLHLEMVGDDSIPNERGSTYKDEFLRQNSGNPILSRVAFSGRLSDAELFEKYADCDVFVAPSRYESFGLIFLEAMMFGKPVIGCRAGGMPEVISENDNGFLTEPGDAASLVEALEKLINDRNLREQFGRRSREIFLQKFTRECMVKSWLAAMNRLFPLRSCEPIQLPMLNRESAVLKVSIISGVLFSKDAISESLRCKARALAEICEQRGIELQNKIFVHGTDSRGDADIVVVGTVGDLVSTPHFQASSLLIYDYGIHTPLFDSIYLAPRGARIWVHFHNITPAEFVPLHQRSAIERSFEQLGNLVRADRVLVGSSYNRETLSGLNIKPQDLNDLNYVIPDAAVPHPRRIRSRKTGVDFLYVGRFVQSKGLHDLVEAMSRIRTAAITNVRLRLVGNLRFSDSDYIRTVKAQIARLHLTELIDWKGDLNDVERDKLYASSDALVMPSYHEGFCVPVIEALRYECFIISYDAGNLRSVSRGLGIQVSTGDVDGLARTMRNFIEELRSARGQVSTSSGLLSWADFGRAARSYASSFSAAAFKTQFETLLEMDGFVKTIRQSSVA